MSGWSVPGVVHLKQMSADPVGRRVLARYRVTRRPLAITYFSPEFLADTGFRARFREECARLTFVRETRIARVHRYVECDRGVEGAVVADHISGTSLRALLSAHGAVDTAAALVVLKDALVALTACHQAGLAHGGLKPEDVILTPAGQVRIVDFGFWTTESRRLLARSTPFYLAPEQWSSSDVSQAGDIYAATVTFFECLAGAPPFYAEEVAELSAKHARSVVPVAVMPEPVREIVSRGLAKDPASRPDAQRLLALVGEVAARAVGPGWERLGRQELAALIANRTAQPEHSLTDRQRGGGAWGYGRPIRLAAVMGGALALAAGLSSPPLAVIPGIGAFGPGAMPPVLAFPDPDQDGMAVRRTTNGPRADPARAVAAKVGIAAPPSPAPHTQVPSSHPAPSGPTVPGGLGQGTARVDSAASTRPGLDQSLPGLPVCTDIGDQPCAAANSAQPGSPRSPSDPSSSSVPASLPVQLPVPVRVPVPMTVPLQLPAPVQQPVKGPHSIVIRDKAELGKDIHIPKQIQAQLDSQRSSFTGHSGEHAAIPPQRSDGFANGPGNSGNQ